MEWPLSLATWRLVQATRLFWVEWELEAGKCGLKSEQLNLTELCLERE